MNKRPHYFFIVAFCVIMLGAALLIQLVGGLEPCPLCIFQRMAIMGIGLIALLAALHNPSGIGGDKIYGSLLILAGLASVSIASRQVWILSLPKDEAASCGPGLEVWLDNFIAYLPQGPVTEILFRSGADCSEVAWSLFGLGLPELTFPVFIVLFVYLIWLFFKRHTPKDGTFSMR